MPPLWTILRAILAPSLAAALCGPALATPFTTTDLTAAQAILSGFNAVATTTYTKNNETEGRVVAGGDLAGSNNGNICFNGCNGTATVNGTAFGAATVYGNVSGPATFTIMNGNAAIRGNLSANSEFGHNGGLSLGGSNSGLISDATFVTTGAPTAGRTQNTGTVTTNAANAFAYGTFANLFATPLNDLVSTVAALVPTLGNVQSIGDNTNNFASTAVAATGGKWSNPYSYGFYTTTGQNLTDAQNFNGINSNNLSAVFVLVQGTGAVSLPTVQNGSSNTRIVWVLPGATSVSLRGLFEGTILAPNATFSNAGGDMSGLAYANAITQFNEFHKDYEFTGSLAGLGAYATDPAASIPEPPSLLLMAGGLPLLALTRRRRIL